jgi:hypothetical protein
LRTSRKEAEEAKTKLENLRMFRIPEGESGLELWIKDDGSFTNKEGAIQMWSYK